MKVSENGGYHAVIEDCSVLQMPDGKSVFKIYYVSIVGRNTPEKYEWAKNPLSKKEYEEAFLASGNEGIGFVTAFPHISKVFRYAPKAEILMLVKAFNTQNWDEINLDRGEGYMEFACLAEAILAAGEYRKWAAANTVEEYLASKCEFEDAPVVVSDKMKKYWEA